MNKYSLENFSNLNEFCIGEKMAVPSIKTFLSQILTGESFTNSDILLIIGIIFLICCSAFFSASETAYSSSNSLRLKTLAEEKQKGARKAIYITENFEKTLSLLLTFNNLVNIASTSIASYMFVKFIANPTLSNILNTVILTIIILIFGEILPKAIAKSNPEKTSLRFSGIVYFLLKFAVFLYYPFYLLQKKALKNKTKSSSATVTENELESIIDTMEEEGVIDHDNKEILHGAINLSELSAYDVMTHRKDVVFIDVNESLESAEKLFLETQYSRLPVFSETIDNIVGVINQKDLFNMMISNKPKNSIKSLMKPCHFVSEVMHLDDLIRELQSEKKHMAIVVDEQGGTSGLVTLEDCIESMFGEIYDEHDEVDLEENIVMQEDNSYIVNADTELTELFEKLEIEHIPESNYSTVGGLIFEKAEELCDVGDVIKIDTIDEQIDEHGNYLSKPITLIFTVMEIESNKIIKAKLEIVEHPIDSDGEENSEPTQSEDTTSND